MNINIELFKRYGADRKMKIVMELTEEEVLATSPATVTRIIKEVGSKRYKSRDKELRIGSERRTGNSWNSTFEEVGIYKKKLYVSLYLQYSNTDTSISEDYNTFFARGDYRGSVEYMDRYGGKQTEYFTYSQNQKAKAMRSILIEYIQRKYFNKKRQTMSKSKNKKLTIKYWCSLSRGSRERALKYCFPISPSIVEMLLDEKPTTSEIKNGFWLVVFRRITIPQDHSFYKTCYMNETYLA